MTPEEQGRRLQRFTEHDDWAGWDPDADLWPSHGGLAIRWAGEMLVHGPGVLLGKPLTFRTDQQLWLFRWFEYHPTEGGWRYTVAYKGEARGSVKTEMGAALGCIDLAGPPEIASTAPDITLVANSFEQADLLFGCAGAMLGGGSKLKVDAPLAEFFDVFDTEILYSDNRPGRIARVAAKAGTNEGGRPSLVVIDEPHELLGKRERVHEVLTKGLLKRKPRGREVAITTAGAGRGSIPPKATDPLWWRKYALGRMVERDPDVAPWFLFDWREAEDGLDPTNPADIAKGVRQASGAADIVFGVDDRVAEFLDPTKPLHESIRYLWNRPVDVAADSWLADAPGAWAAGTDETLLVPDGAEVMLGIDMSLRGDSTALGIVHRLDDERQAWAADLWESVAGKIDYIEVKARILELRDRYTVLGLVYDPRLFELFAAELEEHERLIVVESPQSTERRSKSDLHAYQLITGGQVVHDGDPRLAEHVSNAVWRTTERGRVLSKGKSGGHIDGLIACSLAAWELEQDDDESGEVNLW